MCAQCLECLEFQDKQQVKLRKESIHEKVELQ